MSLDPQSQPPAQAECPPAPQAMAAPEHRTSGRKVVCLDTLVAALEACFAADPRGSEAASLLERYAAECNDWQEYTFFEDSHYTRNLIARNQQFELMLLCWSRGQVSPIHNHEGQNCWAAVVDGPLEETRYKAAPPGQAPPRVGDVMRCEQGDVSFIRDDIALHVVGAGQEKPAVTLHLYAKPYDACNVYCQETGQVTRKRLTYDSVRGVQR
jgi:cysteine dioxygenase